jgi:hypothetical protein
MRKPTKEYEDYIRENLRYDPETGHLWWIKPSGRRQLDKPVGCINKTRGYVCFTLGLTDGQVYCTVHRIAWFLYYGCWPKELLDHLNGIKTDNRIENLREASQQQNLRNQKSRTGSSKYKGVSWSKQSQKWRVDFRYNEKANCFGFYTSEEEAALAYDKAARELHGDYARLNFPEEHEQGALHGHDV